MMRMKKELPLATDENLCHLYLNYQDINSICFNEKHYKNFFYSNYLNCYSVNLDWYKFQYIPDNTMLYQGRFVDTKVVDSTIFNSRLTRNEIFNFILHSINNNYYVDIYVDEYLLPGTMCYNNEHYPHEELIYGYDLLAKKFKFLGINKNGQTAKISIEFDIFLDAIESLQNDYFKQQYNYDVIKYYPNFRLFKFKPEWVDFDIRIVSKQLDSYIKGEDPYTLYSTASHSICYLQKEQKIYGGISVYDNYANYINTLEDSEMINVPFAYGLMEFVVIMKNRIQYIFKFGEDIFPNSKRKEIIEKFNDLITEHSQLVNMCVRENMRFPRIGNRKKLILVADSLKEKVLVFYKILYEIIIATDYKVIMNNNRFYYGVVGDNGSLLSKL